MRYTAALLEAGRMLLLIAAASALEPIDHAVAVHFSKNGLDHLGQGIAKLAPTHLTVGATAGELVCDEATPDAVLSYALDGLELGINLSSIELTPSPGRIDLYLRGTLDSDRRTLTVTGDCAVLTDLAEVCTVELPTTTLEAHIGLTITQVGTSFDVVTDIVALNLSPIGNPLDGCLLSSAIGTLLGQNPSAITDLLTGLIQPSLAELGPSLEEPLEDALNQLTLATSLSLGDAILDISISPDSLTLDENGLLIGLAATLNSDAASDCVGEAPEPSTNAEWPEITGVTPDGSLEYDAAVLVNKELVDGLLYLVWKSGLLCQNISELNGSALETSLFSEAFGEEWAELFPEASPMVLSLVSNGPPTIRFSGNDAPFRLVLEGTGLRVMGELEARMAKVFGLDLGGEIGIDVAYDGSMLNTGLVIDPTWMELNETDHELLSYGYSDGLASILPAILPVVLSAVTLPSFAVPSYQGLGLEGLWWQPDSSGLWMGGYATLSVGDVEPIELPACEGVSLGCDGGSVDYDLESALGCSEGLGCESGCDAESCGGGTTCTTGQKKRGGSPLPFLIAGLMVWWRRRS